MAYGEGPGWYAHMGNKDMPDMTAWSSTPPTTRDPDLPEPGTKRFHWSDYLIFAVFLLANIGVGLYQGLKPKKEETAKHLLVADRSLSVLPVSLSLISAFLSAVLILGTSAEIYTEGTQFWMHTWGAMIGCVFAALLFVPLLYPLHLTSAYEYLETRYNHKAPKLLATIILIIMQLLYMGVVLFSPATALEAVTGFPVWASILIGGVIGIVYTALGGMKASVWASVVQSIFMLAGILLVIIKGSVDMGGFGNVWSRNYNGGRIQFWDFDTNPLKRHTFWTLVVGGAMKWFAQYGTNQASVQRFSSVPTLKEARATVLINIPFLFVFLTLCSMMGMVLFAWYDKVGCDPLKAGYIENSNQLIPFYVMDRLGYPCVPGIFLGSLFAGALSSMSSSLSSLSAVFWSDVLTYCCGNYSHYHQTVVIKCLVVIFGLLGIGMAFVAQNLGGTVLQAAISFQGAAGGPILGLFILGGFFPCTNWIGAVVGGILGLIFPLWLSFGSYAAGRPKVPLNTTIEQCLFIPDRGANDTMTTPWGPIMSTPAPTSLLQADDMSGLDRMYTMSYLWYPSIGAAIVVVVGILFSCFTGCSDPSDMEVKYHLPFFDWICCCCPNRSLHILRCKKPKYDPYKEERNQKDTYNDDPVVVDHNGVEIDKNKLEALRSNMGIDGKPPSYTTYDNAGFEAGSPPVLLTYRDAPLNGSISDALISPEAKNESSTKF